MADYVQYAEEEYGKLEKENEELLKIICDAVEKCGELIYENEKLKQKMEIDFKKFEIIIKGFKMASRKVLDFLSTKYDSKDKFLEDWLAEYDLVYKD